MWCVRDSNPRPLQAGQAWGTAGAEPVDTTEPLAPPFVMTWNGPGRGDGKEPVPKRKRMDWPLSEPRPGSGRQLSRQRLAQAHLMLFPGQIEFFDLLEHHPTPALNSDGT
jgi:hypothetical protein